MKLRVARLILATSIVALSTPALADLFPQLTHDIQPELSPGSVDAYADAFYTVVGPPAPPESVDDFVVVNKSTEASGDILLAYGPSLEGGPGRIYFKGANITTPFQASDALDMNLAATPGPDGLAFFVSDLSFTLVMGGGYPRAELRATGTPGLFDWGPIDLPLAVNRTVDWDAEVDGNQWMFGKLMGGPVSVVSVSGTSTSGPLGPGVAFDFALTGSEIGHFESAPVASVGTLELDAIYGLDVPAFEIVAVPEPMAGGAMAGLLCLAMLARRRPNAYKASRKARPKHR